MFREVMERSFLNNRVEDYLVAIGVLVLGIVMVRVIRQVIAVRLRRLAERTATTVDDFLMKTMLRMGIPLLYYGVFYVATQTIFVRRTIRAGIKILGIALLTFLGIRFVLSAIEYALTNYWRRKHIDVERERSYKAILPAISVVVWGLGVIFLLENLNVKISSVVFGLGIGGVAVALAAQAVLGDLFSYFAILFDRPFEVGDFITVGDLMGTVEHIGIKTVRIRSLSGEQLVFSNHDLTNSRVRNYKRMEKRRVLFKLGVTYETTHEQLSEIPGIIKTIINGVEGVTFDRAHFSEYGDFSLIFEVVYYVMSSDYTRYMDVQQEINFALKGEFEKLGIEFAYPTQTIFIAKQ